MAYEFTNQKLQRERKAFVKRLVVAVASGAAGFALGVSMSDMGGRGGILAATVLAIRAGLGAFYAVDVWAPTAKSG